MTAAPPPILHHYDTSPYSEKIRKLLAHKRVRWACVEQPSIMPKPDLVPLTGGYRRIPVLQIGADVYCDTQLISRVLERRWPEPTIYPGASEGTCHAWNLWADRLAFLPAVACVFAEIGQFVPREFMEDRSRMMPGRDFSEIPRQAPHAREQLRSLIALLEVQLTDRRPWLLGPAFSLADAACFHPLWFLRVAPQASAMLTEFPAVGRWMARIDALGRGDCEPMTTADALAVARAHPPTDRLEGDPREPNGLVVGERVTVTPDDYAFDPVAGDLVFSTPSEVAVRRSDPAVGEVVVHFPRVGFRVARAA